MDDRSCSGVRRRDRRGRGSSSLQSSLEMLRMPAKQPIRKHPTTGMVCGRNYYLPEMLRSMPRLVKGSRPYLEWFEAEMNAAGEPDVVLEAGVKRCDVLMLEYDTGDPFADDRTQLEYIGADTM